MNYGLTGLEGLALAAVLMLAVMVIGLATLLPLWLLASPGRETITTRRKDMLISYSNGIEVLICRPDTERNLLRIWFDPEGDRRVNDYVRKMSPTGIIEIRAPFDVNVD